MQEIIRLIWQSAILGAPAFRVKAKLQQCLFNLHQWHRQTTGSIPIQIASLENQLCHQPVEQNISEMDLIQHRLEFLYDCHDMMLAQRSKSLWLLTGDRNTKYFHASVKHRKNQKLDWSFEISSRRMVV